MQIKRAKMTEVDPYYGRSNSRSVSGPTVYGISYKADDTVWFTRKADAVIFAEWVKHGSWDGIGDLEITMRNQGVQIKGKIVSGH
jgi:hypothetical protein